MKIEQEGNGKEITLCTRKKMEKKGNGKERKGNRKETQEKEKETKKMEKREQKENVK